MAIYQNPYGGDDDSQDPAAMRRKAILDLMGTPSRSTAATPDALSSSDSSDPGAGAPPTTASSTSTAAAAPYKNPDDGRQYGTKILDLYDDPYTRRNTYGGSDPKRQAIASALVSSGNPYAMAAGGLGYLDAYLHRQADTAPTDFGVDDARQIIKNAYRDMFGRDATDQEVQDALTGQGLKAGGQWVGQAGLQGVLGHLAENAAAERAAGGGPAGAGATSAAGDTSSSGTSPASSSAAPAAAATASDTTAGGGGNMAGLEGFDAGKFNDPNKSDPKYDFGHIVSGVQPGPAGLDSVWDKILAKFPNAKRISDDKVDFGDGSGPVDVIRAGDQAWHWEPVNDSGSADSAASAAPTTAPASSLPALPGAAQLAAPLTDNNVYAQIQQELARIMAGQPPRAAILAKMGLPNG